MVRVGSGTRPVRRDGRLAGAVLAAVLVLLAVTVDSTEALVNCGSGDSDRMCLTVTAQLFDQGGERKKHTTPKHSEIRVFNVRHENWQLAINFNYDAATVDGKYPAQYLLVVKTHEAGIGNINKLNSAAAIGRAEGFSPYLTLGGIPTAGKVVDMRLKDGWDPTHSLYHTTSCRTPRGAATPGQGKCTGKESCTCTEAMTERVIYTKLPETGYYDVLLCHSGWTSYTCMAMNTIKVIDRREAEGVYSRGDYEQFKDLPFPSIDEDDIDLNSIEGLNNANATPRQIQARRTLVRSFADFVLSGTAHETVRKCEIVRKGLWVADYIPGHNRISAKVIKWQLDDMTSDWRVPESVRRRALSGAEYVANHMDVVAVGDSTLRAFEKLTLMAERAEPFISRMVDSDLDIDDDGFLYFWRELRKEAESSGSDSDDDDRAVPQPPAPSAAEGHISVPSVVEPEAGEKSGGNGGYNPLSEVFYEDPFSGDREYPWRDEENGGGGDYGVNTGGDPADDASNDHSSAAAEAGPSEPASAGESSGGYQYDDADEFIRDSMNPF